GIVRRKPKLTPDAISMRLFGPGVIDVTNAKTNSPKNASNVNLHTPAREKSSSPSNFAQQRLALHTLRTAVHRCNTGAAHLDQPQRLHDRYELIDLRCLAGDLEDELLGGCVRDLGLEGVGEAKSLDPRLTFSCDFDQGQFPLQRVILTDVPGAHSQISHLVNGDDPFQLALDLLENV